MYQGNMNAFDANLILMEINSPGSACPADLRCLAENMVLLLRVDMVPTANNRPIVCKGPLTRVDGLACRFAADAVARVSFDSTETFPRAGMEEIRPCCYRVRPTRSR